MKTLLICPDVLLEDYRAIEFFIKQGAEVAVVVDSVYELHNVKHKRTDAGLNASKVLSHIEQLSREDNLFYNLVEPGLQVIDIEGSDIIEKHLNAAKAYGLTIVTNDTRYALGAQERELRRVPYVGPPSPMEIPARVCEASESLLVDLMNGTEVPSSELGDFLPNEFFSLIEENPSEEDELLGELLGQNKNEFIKILEDIVLEGGIGAKNKEQAFALDALTDDSIPLVFLTGKAGVGKTYLAIAAGLHQCLRRSSFGGLLVTRPIVSLGKDLGMLPGTKEEKMAPWLMPITDNINQIIKQSTKMQSVAAREGIIEVQALSHIRGRSIINKYMIVDEAQNLSVEEAKAIITRIGDKSKLIMIGDPYQSDTGTVKNNGLVYALENLRDSKLCAHVHLTEGKRSKLSELAANKL